MHVDKSPGDDIWARHNLVILKVNHGNSGHNPFFRQEPPFPNLGVTNRVTGIPTIDVDVRDTVNVVRQPAGVLRQGQHIPIFEDEAVFLWNPRHLGQLGVDLLHPVFTVNRCEELRLHQPQHELFIDLTTVSGGVDVVNITVDNCRTVFFQLVD